MAEGNVEIVRGVYKRWGRGDFAADAELFDPHVVLVMGSAFPDAGTYHGTDGMARYTRGFLEPWDRITIDADEVIEAGDSVVVGVIQRGTGSQSGAVTELRYFHVWTFRGGRTIRFETIRDRSDALAAVGLADA